MRRVMAMIPVLGVALLLAGAQPGPVAAAFPYSCNLATLHGVYGGQFAGTVSPDGVNQVPLTDVGLFRSDGAGGMTGHDTVSFGGQVFERDLVGTYSVTRECQVVFVVSVVGDKAPPFVVSGVLVDGGNSTVLMGASPGSSFWGRSYRIAPSL